MANVGYATLQIIPSAQGFASALNGQTAGPMVAGGKKGGKAFGGGMIAAAKGFAGPLAAVFAGTAALGFFKDAVAGASDLSETTSKIGVVFGKAGADVLAFASKSATALGQTKQAALDGAATFGVFGKAAGLTGKDLAGFSTEMVQLSTDLASFHNTSPEEAIDALGAALRGETEPIRRYGVLLDDMSLRQEAVRQGLIKTTKEGLTPQQKTLAAHALIMKQTKDAQGDFARTSGGLANQQRILSAQWTDMKTRLGAGLLPIVTKTVTVFNSWIPKVIQIGQQIGAVLGPAFTRAGAVLKSFFDGAGGGTSVLDRLGVKFEQVRPFLVSLGETFRRYGQFLMTTVIPAVSQLVMYVGQKMVPVFRQVWQIITTQVLPIIQSLASWIATRLVPQVFSIVQAIGTRLRPVFDQLVATYRANVLPAIQQLLVKFREWQPTIQKVVSFLVTLIGHNLKLSATILGKVLPPVIKLAGFLIGNLVRSFVASISIAVKMVGAVISFGRTVVNAVSSVARFVSGLKSKFGEALTFVKGIPGKIKSGLGKLGSILFSAGADIIRGLINGMGSMVGALQRKAAGIANGIKNTIKSALNIASPSKVMIGYGKFIGQGLAIGMDKSARQVNKSALALTAFPTSAAGNAALAAGSGTSGLGGPTYNFYGRNVDINERTVVPLIHGASVRARVGRPR